MSNKASPQSDEEILRAFTDLFDQVMPETPEDFDTALLEAGLDPDEIAAEVRQVVRQGLANSPHNWRNFQQKLEEAKAEVETAEMALSDTATMSYIIEAIQMLLSLPRMQSVGAHYRGEKLEKRSKEELRALFGELKYLADQDSDQTNE
jgi:hypothetical protein